MNYFPDKISWNGWTATLDSLKAAGWTIYQHRNYFVGTDSYGKPEYFHLRHNATKMIARFTPSPTAIMCPPPSLPDESEEVDFLTHERNKRIKPHPIYEYANLTEDDIGELLAVLLRLQEDRKKSYPPKKAAASNETVLVLLKTA